MSVDAMVKLSEAPWTCGSDGYVGMWLKMDVARLEKPLFETKRKTQNCCAVLGIPFQHLGEDVAHNGEPCGLVVSRGEESHLEGQGSADITGTNESQIGVPKFRPAEPRARQSIGA